MAVLGLTAKQDFCTKCRVGHDSGLARKYFRASLLAGKGDMSPVNVIYAQTLPPTTYLQRNQEWVTARHNLDIQSERGVGEYMQDNTEL